MKTEDCTLPVITGVDASSAQLDRDTDASGMLTLYDALSVARAAVDGRVIPAGDVNGDGKVSLADVLSAIRILAN